MTLKEYRVELGWTITQMAKEADISRLTIASAERGEAIHADKALAIAKALSRGYKKTIRVRSIEGLKVL